MIDEPRSTSPESAVDAVADDAESKSDITINPNSVEPFVAAFRVSREHDGSVLLQTPLSGGRELRIVSTHIPQHDLDTIPRLPIKDLANPGVALVVSEVLSIEAMRERSEELSTALEPFADVANG